MKNKPQGGIASRCIYSWTRRGHEHHCPITSQKRIRQDIPSWGGGGCIDKKLVKTKLIQSLPKFTLKNRP